jgi:hypothetical protein
LVISRKICFVEFSTNLPRKAKPIWIIGDPDNQLSDKCSSTVLHKVKGREECPAYNKKKEDQIDWPHLAYELLFKTRYRMKERGKNRSDGKTRKKT